MQVAIIYDPSQVGQRLIERLTKKYGEPTYFESETGEVIYKNLNVTAIITEILPFIDNGVVFHFIVGGNEEDMTQFLTL